LSTRRIFDARISTLISGACHYFARSLASATSLECVHCGLKLSARHTGGTLEFDLDIRSVPPNLSRFKHSAVLTTDGKLSILCECETFDVDALGDSGHSVGTYSSPTNSARTQREARYTADDWRYVGRTIFDHAQECGCDPVADHMCSPHRNWLTDRDDQNK